MLRRVFRNPVLIVLLMLAAAAIACDDPVSPPQVTAVLADPESPGTAFALVNMWRTPGTSAATDAVVLYETRDYGASWQRSAQSVRLDPPPRSYDLTMRGETLVVGRTNTAVWSFPRPGFRHIFHSDVEDITFVLPYGAASNDRSGDTLYVSMGTEGVLVGTFPSAHSADWQTVRWDLRAGGIDTLNPLKLTIHDPATIAGIIVLALFCPPLVFMHRFVLRRVWRYVTDDTGAGSLALTVSAVIAVLAAIALALWLVDIRLDLYPIIAGMTVVTVLAGSSTAFALAQRLNASPANRLRLVAATAVVSLLIPAGVAALWWLWWLIILLLFGYLLYRTAYQNEYGVYLERIGHPHPRWLLDRLTLETVLPLSVVVMVVAAALWVGPSVVYTTFGRDRFSDALVWLAVGVLAAIIGWGMKLHIDGRIIQLLALRGAAPDDPDLLPKRPLKLAHHIGTLILWVLGTVVLSGVLLFAQAQAYGWFNSLLR